MKKKIVIIALIIGAGMLLIYGMLSFFSFDLEDFLYEEKVIGNSIMPYEPDFNENILEDEKYLDLDRNIYYTELATGVTLSIDESNYTTYDGAVPFMFEYIKAIIGGQTNFYNDCYNDLYIAAVGKQPEFTQQKLYDIEFAIIRSGTDSASGKEYVKLWLDYKIMKNNITLRNDIGSDVCRRQYLTLVKEENDSYKIQAVEYENIKPEKVLILSHAIALVAIVFAVIAAVVTAIIVISVRKRKKRSVGDEPTLNNESSEQD